MGHQGLDVRTKEETKNHQSINFVSANGFFAIQSRGLGMLNREVQRLTIEAMALLTTMTEIRISKLPTSYFCNLFVKLLFFFQQII